MTLCVAAICKKSNYKDVVVMATDFQVEGETTRADIGKKRALVGWEYQPVLLAGTLTRATQLMQEISRTMGEHKLLPKDEWPRMLRVAVRQQKRALAEEYISGCLGMEYEEFIDKGKEKLPEEVFRDMAYQITKQELGCTILFVGFSQNDPNLYRVHESGLVEECTNFAAIGSGAYIAESSLFQREHRDKDGLGITIYRVYEAMRLGSYAPGVGKKFRIVIAEWEYFCDGTEENTTNEGIVSYSRLKPEYYRYLETQFRKFGPRRPTQIALKPNCIKHERNVYRSTPIAEKNFRKEEAAMRSASRKLEPGQ